MAIIKSYTDLEQSKKLAEFLPLESADMFYNEEPEDETYPKDIVDTEYPMVLREGHIRFLEEYGIPCWSIATLLDVLPDIHLKKYTYDGITKYYATLVGIRQFNSKHYDNPVDACYDAIVFLHELKML